MKKYLKIVLLLVLFFFFKGTVFAASVNLNVIDGTNTLFSSTVTIPTGITSLSDSSNTTETETIDPSSMLAVVDSASTQSGSTWSISNLTYYSSLQELYLKCITDSVGNECDNWQYVVNGSYPSAGMDQTILHNGDTVYLYFGPQNQVILSANNITTNDTLTVTANNYNYQHNTWVPAVGSTVGIIQPNSYPTVEIQTKTVDANGKATFSSISVGSYSVGIQPNYFPTTSLIVTAPPVIGSGGGQLTSSTTTPEMPTTTATTPNSISTPMATTVPTTPAFDTNKAMNFLTAQQIEDGSFGVNLYTDWSAMALASSVNNQTQILKLIKYYEQSKLTNPNLTDYERHAMALMALGLNPYNTNGENYINDIVKSFDGKQFGNPNQDNDDIFALIVLQNAGYTSNDSIISTDLTFILSKQDSYGSWDNSIDLTGAAMEALSTFNQTGQVRDALAKAENYLEQNQKADGSWNDNASSTAWAIEGILAQNEKPEDWAKNKITPLDYLATIQDTDGGVKDSDLNTKIWETAYVTSALSGKTWNQIMQSFNKEDLSAPIANSPTQTSTLVLKTESKIAKIYKPATKNTASVLNSITPSISSTPTPQKNWFERLLAKIF